MNTKFDIAPEGPNRIVYVRPVAVADLPPEVQVQAGGLQTIYAVHDADGAQIALVADRRTAFFFSTSYPVERTADRAAKAVAQLDLEARRRNLRQREYEVEAEVRTAARALSRIRKSVLLQRQSVDLAEPLRKAFGVGAKKRAE